MADHFEDLTAEYETLMQAAGDPGGMTISGWNLAILHILRRLGPPSLTEASEIERREAPERE